MKKLFVLVLLGSLLAAQPSFADPAPIKVGGLFSASALALYTKPALNGARLALDGFNEAGGLGGRQVELVQRDDQGKPDVALRVLEDLKSREHVSAILGTSYAHVTLVANSFSQKNKLPTFMMWGTSNDLTWRYGQPYFFAIETPPELMAKAIAEEMAKLPAKRWATITPDYEAGHALVDAFKRELAARRPDVVFVESLWPPIGHFDGGPMVNALAAAKPDAIFNFLFASDLAQYVRLAKKSGLLQVSTFHYSLGWAEEAAGLKDEVPEGWYVSGFPSDTFDLPAYLAFKEKYKARFGEDPVLSSLYSYINTQFYLAALQKAGTTDADKLSAAAEGLEIDTPMGRVKMRAIDHRSTAGYFLGRLEKKDGKTVMTGAHRIDVEAFSPSDDWILSERNAK